ncbi:nitrate/sulfonate/taurine/bicarbonate ABC transporter, permease protein [Desulfosarcina variabilis str. Montpellier]
MRNLPEFAFRNISRSVPLILFLVLWELAARFGPFSTSAVFPPFSAVIMEMGALIKSGVMTKNLASTVGRVLIGLLMGTLSGILVGIAMGWRDAVGRSLSPVISILYPIPALGWLPLMMLWIGINEMLPVAIITVGAFFPTCYNTAAGIRNVDRGMIKAAHILGASEKRILFEVILPNAAPHLFSGLRLSSGMAWRTVLAAEMVAIPTGIGALIMKAESLVRVDIIMSCLVVLSFLCLIFEKILNLMERRWTGKWSNGIARD